MDVGSGYGKAVLHAGIEVGVRRAVGIECVISRHEIAEQVRRALGEHGRRCVRQSCLASKI